MKKKVLFINASLTDGGSERVMTVLANGLVERENFDVTMVLTREKDEQKYELDKKINCIQFRYRYNNKIYKCIRRAYMLRKLIKDNNFDAIISFMYDINLTTIIASFGLKENLIISERNDPNKIGRIQRIFVKHLYNNAKKLVCQTDDAKKWFPKKIQEKTVVIPNPIKPNLPTPWEGERRKEIVNFCRLTKQKNLKLLIDAFEQIHKEYNDYRLTIYGEGSERVELEDYIKKRGLENCAKIMHSEISIHDKIIKSKMFVSSSDYEGLSNSMLEAMAIGLPVICTDCPCGGAKMIINNNKNGILVPVGDINELYKAMKKVIEDKEFARAISKKSVEIRNRLDKNIICDRWIKLM